MKLMSNRLKFGAMRVAKKTFARKSMLTVDYEKDDYHQKRHAELIRDEGLQHAWAYCARQFYFRDLPTQSSIFEFGGALGYNLLALTEQHQCHMLELSEIGRAHARKFGITTYSTLADVPQSGFDAVLCRHVLEHVDNPLQTLEALRQLKKPASPLILVLPVESAVAVPVKAEIDFHLFTWNPRTISNLLTKAGYSNINHRFQFFNGRRLCLPIFRNLGSDAYVKAVETLGRLRRSRELVVTCQ